jgi:hypothetical protein
MLTLNPSVLSLDLDKEKIPTTNVISSVHIKYYLKFTVSQCLVVSTSEVNEFVFDIFHQPPTTDEVNTDMNLAANYVTPIK